MPRTMTAHVEDALAERVDELAKRLDRPRGWLISKALEQFVELEDTRDRLTREGHRESAGGKERSPRRCEGLGGELKYQGAVVISERETWRLTLRGPRKRWTTSNAYTTFLS